MRDVTGLTGCKRHCTVRPEADALESMLELPLATAEFIAVDTETNGLGGERCELTEVGAVLVGGGELHEEWGSLVGVAQPLGRYIQRFTGISQEMVDKAPDPEDVLPRLAAQLRGRVLGARKVRARPATVPRRPRGERPYLAALPHEPGVYVFRDADGKPLYVGKSVDLRVRARSHFTSGASWTQQAEHVDHTVTESELGALLLEDRLIKALKPPGNVRGKADPDGYVYIR